MPIRPRRLFVAGLLANILLASHGDLRHSLTKPKFERLQKQEQIVTLDKHDFLKDLEELCVSEPLDFGPDNLVISKFFDKANSLSGFERAQLFKTLKTKYPREVYFVLEVYMFEKAKELGLNPELAKTIFYVRKFDLINPLGISDLESMSRLLKRKINVEQLFDDPFLSIDLGLEILKNMLSNSPKSSELEILTRYIFGQFRNRTEYSKKLALTKKYFDDCLKNYNQLRVDLAIRNPGNEFLRNVYIPKEYAELSFDVFKNLPKELQQKEIRAYVSFLANKLQIPEKKLLDLVRVESRFDYTAFNKVTRALGLLQVRPITFNHIDRFANLTRIIGKKINFEELSNPYYGLLVGALYYKYCYVILGSYAAADIAYNIGLEDFLKKYPVKRSLQKSGIRYTNKLSMN